MYVNLINVLYVTMYYVEWRNDYCSDSCTDYVIFEIFNKGKNLLRNRLF